MNAFIKISNGNFKRIASFIMVTVLCVFLPAQQAEAGWLEDQFNSVQSKLNSIRSNLNTVNSRVTNVFNKVIDASGSISDGKVQNLITDMKVMLQAAVDTQQAGVAEFMDGGNCAVNDGTPCGFFRADLIELVHIMRGLNNQILALPSIPGLNLQIQDLGFADLINKIPGRALLPLYKVLEKTQLLDPVLIDALQNAGNELANLKTFLFGATAVPAAQSTTTFTFAPAALGNCQFVNNHPNLNIIAITYDALGMLTEVLGAVFQAFGETVIGGPSEVDAGVHGYIHGTLNTNNLGSFGELLGAFSGAFAFVGSKISDRIGSCEDMARDDLLFSNQAQIILDIAALSPTNPNLELNQALILENQQSILEGLLETRCAIRKNKPSQCERFRGNGFGGKKKPLP